MRLLAIDSGPGLMLAFTVPVRTKSRTNARGHWARGARETKAQRAATLLSYQVARATQMPVHPPCAVTMTRVAPRPLDDDNLRDALKAVRDELAHILGLPNDRDPRVAWEYAQERGEPKEYAVLVEVRTMEPQSAGAGGSPMEPSPVGGSPAFSADSEGV